ncbi:MAG: hypothetical protein WCJ35_24705 [Planctomycetota bacterium]
MANSKGRTDSVETHTMESLRKIITTIRGLLAPAIRLAGDPDEMGSAGLMDKEGITSLEISFQKSLDGKGGAFEQLRRWGGACEDAWNDYLITSNSRSKATKTTLKSGLGTQKPRLGTQTPKKDLKIRT